MKNLSFLIVAAALFMGACRGQISSEPPIHIVPDMDWQPKYQAQGKSAFFEDGKAQRPVVDGTVAQGALRENEEYSDGKKDGQWVNVAPIEPTEKTFRRGQERFNIYCAPCHSQSGAGNGLVVQHGYPVPISLSSEHPMSVTDGELYSYIKNGIRNMPAYGHMIPESDRWAIVAWVRVLQRSQHTSAGDVPADKVNSIQAEEK